jgi:hypothetical protein
LKDLLSGKKDQQAREEQKRFRKTKCSENLHVRQWDGFATIPGHEHVESRGSTGGEISKELGNWGNIDWKYL